MIIYKKTSYLASEKKAFKYLLIASVIFVTSFYTQFLFSELPQISPTDPELQKITLLNTAQLTNIINFIQQREKINVTAWSSQYHVIPELINKYNLDTGAEIGVAFGTQSIEILQNTHIKKWNSIDPYQHFLQSAYNDGMNIEQKHFDVLHYVVQKRLHPFKERSSLIRKTSVEAVQLFNTHELDIIYIDGNHSYESVKNDLNTWYEKIRPGGIIAGDDYGHPQHQGVKKAVDEFFTEKKITLNFNNRTFWAQKPHYISFIIPVYNRAHTVRQAIDSIYQQNLEIPFEVICVDDASSDKTRDILLSYQEKYPNFKFYIHEHNLGASEARNTAISHAQGDLIFNLDSDNILVPNSVGKLVDLLDETGCETATFEQLYFFEKEGKIHHSCTFNQADDKQIYSLKHLVKNGINPICSGNYLYTKKSYDRAGGYSGNILETWDFGIRQLITGTKIAILKDSFYWHRLSNDGKWVQNQKLGQNNQKSIDIACQHLEIFEPESATMIQNYKQNNQPFLSDLGKNKFKLICSDALDHLTLGYKYLAENKINPAIYEFENAVKLGCSHEKVANLIKILKNKITITSH